MLSGSTVQDPVRRTTSEASLILPPEIAAQIIAHARAGYPEEVCGLVAGAAGRATIIYPGRNISPTPRVSYKLDHDTLTRMIDIEDAGLELLAIYHSHPNGPEIPSHVDVEQAYYPESIYLICSLANPDQPVLRGFRIGEDRFQEAPDIGAGSQSGVGFQWVLDTPHTIS